MTQERWHPDDMRTLGAFLRSVAMFEREGGVDPIKWTDKLLADLGLTAKPDPNTVTLPIPKAATNVRYVLDGKEYEVGGPGEPTQVRPSAQCAPKLDPRLLGPCLLYIPDDAPETRCTRSHPHDNPCKDHDLLTELARANNQLANAGARADHIKGRAERDEMALDAIAQVINGETKPVLPTELVKQVVMLKTELGWMKEHKAEGEKLLGESNLKIQELGAESKCTGVAHREYAEAWRGRALKAETIVSQQASELVELKAHISAIEIARRKLEAELAKFQQGA